MSMMAARRVAITHYGNPFGVFRSQGINPLTLTDGA